MFEDKFDVANAAFVNRPLKSGCEFLPLWPPWLARRLRNHLQAFGLVGAPAPAMAEEPTQAVAQDPAEEAVQEPATEQPEPTVAPKAKATKKAAKKK